MAEDNTRCRALPQCDKETVLADSSGCVAEKDYFSVCLPWDGRIWQDESGVHANKGTPPPDGVYDRIVIANGCIVNARVADNVPIYTGSPCAPLPGDCSGGGGSGGGSGNLCNPSATPGNLYKCDLSGRPLVTVGIEGGAGITVTGTGTTADPFIISGGGGSSGGGIFLKSGNDAIKITGSGSQADPYVIAHKSGKQVNINGLVFDQYGHLIDTGSGSANQGVAGIIPGDGIDVSTDPKTNIATIKLDDPLNKKQGNWQLGGYTVTLDKYNRITNIQQSISLPANSKVSCGDYELTINQYGSITAIEKAGGGAGDDGDSDVSSAGDCFFFNWNSTLDKRNTWRAKFRLIKKSRLIGKIYYESGNSDAKIETVFVRIGSVDCQVKFAKNGDIIFWSDAIFGQGEHALRIRVQMGVTTAYPDLQICATINACAFSYDNVVEVLS